MGSSSTSHHRSRSPTRKQRRRHSHGDEYRHSHKHKHRRNKSRSRSRSRSPTRRSQKVAPDNEKTKPEAEKIDVIAQLRELAQKHNNTASNNNNKKSRRKSGDGHSHLSRRTPMVPKTKEVYEKERSVINREYDPQTGRMRLVRATGEILESIVSRDQQYQINKAATIGDGIAYQAQIAKKC
ncbi:nuclear RNA-splicing-associated protein-domain-containing protein [Phycomyces blakesleeanus]